MTERQDLPPGEGLTALMKQRSEFLAALKAEVERRRKSSDNELELLVTNTLANFLSTWSPPRGWAKDQLDCGVFGPVTVRWRPRGSSSKT